MKIINIDMKEISMKRIFRWFLASFLVMILTAYIFGVGIASAEVTYSETLVFTGGVSNTETTLEGGTISNGGGDATCTPCIVDVLNKFQTYKRPIKFLFANNFGLLNGGSGTYQLTAAANGINAKYVSFSATVDGIDIGIGRIGWERTSGNNFNYAIYFDQLNNIAFIDSLVTEKTIIFTYNKNVYSTYVSGGDYGVGNEAGTTNPTYSWATGETSIIGQSIGKKTGLFGYTYASYTFDAVADVSFNNITGKSGWLNFSKNSNTFRVQIINATNGILSDTTDATNINYYVGVSDGLGYNLYYSGTSSWANRTLYNNNGVFVYVTVTPVPTPVINPVTGSGIIFDKNNYSVNDVSTISYITGSSFFSWLYDYYVVVSKDGTTKQEWHNLNTQGSLQYQFTETGNYYATFYKKLSLLGATQISQANANVQAFSSYLFANNPVPRNKNFTIQYSFGFNPLNAVWTTGIKANRFDGTAFVLEKFQTLNNGSVINSTTTYTENMSLARDGNYTLCLWSALVQKCVANIELYVVYQQVVPTKNITTSYITIDKSLYSWGDYIQGSYAVDNTNFSTKSIAITVTSSQSQQETIYQPVADQTGTFNIPIQNNQLYDPTNYYNIIGQMWVKLFYQTGANIIALNATNDTNFVTQITNSSFILATTDIDGYGLTFNKITLCPQDKLIINVYAPSNSTLRVETNTGIKTMIANYTIQGNRTITYQPASYIKQLYISLTDANNTLRREQIIENSACNAVVDNKIEQASQAKTLASIDGWVSLMGYGTNASTKFLFASIITIFFFICGYLLTFRSGAGGTGATFMGLIPFGFFVYIAYFPIWFVIIFVVMIVLKLGWFR